MIRQSVPGNEVNRSSAPQPEHQVDPSRPHGNRIARRELLASMATAGASSVALTDSPASAADPPGALTPTPVKTGAYTMSPGDFVPVDASGGSVTIALPARPVDQTQVGAKVIGITEPNVVTISCGGSDVFDRSGGPSSLRLASLDQGVLLQYQASTALWYVFAADLRLNVPHGAARLGFDRTVGGPNGSPLSSLIVTSGVQGGDTGAPSPKTVWSFQPVDRDKGPFALGIGGASFNGVWDTVMYLGYNVDTGGGRRLNTEPAFYLAIEQDYVANAGGHHLIESYFEYMSADGGFTRRPLFFHIDRTSNGCTVEIAAHGLSFTDWDDNAVEFASMSHDGALYLMGRPNQTTDTLLSIRARNGKNATIVVDSDMGNWTLHAVGRGMWAQSVGGFAALQLRSIDAPYDGAVVAVGAADTGQGATMAIQTYNGLNQVHDTLLLKRTAGQTQRLLNLKDERGSVLGGFDAAGYFTTRKNGPPSATGIAAGEMTIWFDDTNGASKLMVTAKQADGTIKTGSLALQ